MNDETISKVLTGETDISKMSRDDFVEMLKCLGRVYISRVMNCVDGTGKSDKEWTALSCIFSRAAEVITEKPSGDFAGLRKALDELVANLEMRASAFNVFSLVDRKVFLDAQAALAATAAELGSAAKAGDAEAARDGTGAADKKPAAFKVGDRVSWADPTTGKKTDGWTVLDAPEIPAEGPSGNEVYRIESDSGFQEEAHARELSYPEGGAR